jgi:hypothetical protein
MRRRRDLPSARLVVLCGLIAGCLLGFQPASAAPMRCSSEQKTCIADCARLPNRSAAAVCVTNCGARQANCMQTGCWDNGRNKYCGLTRQ